MKQNFILSVIATVFFILAAICFSSGISKAQSLTYSQVTSSGLSAVTFEMGYTEIELGDVDGDGDLDIVSIGDHGSPNINATESGVMVWKNNGTGTSWSLTKTGSFGYGGIALGDVNNDGKMDIGYAMHHNYSGNDFGDQLIEVALGNGTGNSWTPYDDSLATNGETYGMFGIDFADVNNDGLLDLASNSFGCCSGIHIYKNNGNGTWTQTDGANAGNSHEWVKFGDFNNDGNVDLATANELGVLWSNNGAGFFTSMENGYLGDYWAEFDIADVNNDGAKDFGVVSSAGDAKVYYYDKSQNKWISISNGLPQSNCIGISLNDMDMDGNTDVILWNAGSVVIYKGDGFGNWTQAGSFAIPETQLASFRTGDLDHDGYPDIVYMAKTSASNSKNMLRVYLHTVANPTLTILPVNPKGFECFSPNSVQFLNWQSSVPSGPNATVTIEFSSAGNSGPWTNVASNLPNNGTYQWTVPAVSSSNCFLKFTITNGSNTQTVITANAFGIGTCTNPPPTGVEESLNVNSFDVYPNPMCSQGYAHFQLEKSSDVKINITDVLGKEISVLVNEALSAGSYNPEIPVENLESGIYFCNMNAGGTTLVKKIVVVK
ncbi:MAG: T9SS type A sorting domain-containing protein [Bacteroidetes bacterium]|nr:T9SS type A sorting domain-containing protein [Bacteroidota bacterium]